LADADEAVEVENSVDIDMDVDESGDVDVDVDESGDMDVDVEVDMDLDADDSDCDGQLRATHWHGKGDGQVKQLVGNAAF
jgi:hypothetical protein